MDWTQSCGIVESGRLSGHVAGRHRHGLRLHVLLRTLRLMHETLQPTAHEAAKGSQGPILPEFERYDPSTDEPSSSAPSLASAYEDPSVKLIDGDGTEYVEAE